MHIVIMGCGRVGSSLARALERRSHEVSVIDVDVDSFRRLGPDFTGRTVKGVGFDKGVLIKAGISTADGFAAVSSGDNSNILAARVVREEFGIDNVVARIYDQGRAQVYEKLGIPTVATVRWAAGQVMTRLLPSEAEPVWLDPSGQVGLVQIPFHAGWIGTPLPALEERIGARIPFMFRVGRGICPDPEIILQDGDLIYVATDLPRVGSVKRLLAVAPAKH
ncbi:TrkA family potassium uptake protein [Brooklawnia cerclae]|uniref:Trk system potassium uptake protein TrkA n=1 Tax=Brooklawnia cerclae TaxID=349934 RepID=A0ABX0SIP5_9ACTN|nr:TrkA family potassium uptake protein [Brooklawnia cerclae]NIH56940.1 trk system potassium uptake protein TrkA [Brooklawnia cerclae]